MRRPRGLPGDAAQRGRGAGATRAGSARHRISVFPALPSPRRVPLGPTSRVAPTATRGSGRGGEEQGPPCPRPGAPDRAERVAHLAPGTRHLL